MRTALITGASSGLGAAMAAQFRNGDYKLILTGRNSERLEEVCDKVGVTAQSITCDLSSPDDIKILVKSLGEDPLDLLINNAGVASRNDFEKTTDEEWTRQWTINMMGPVRLTRSLFSNLKKTHSSKVINISSAAALRPVLGLSVYSAVKAAMAMWTQSLAQEWAPYGIRVNCICPGIVQTPILGNPSEEQIQGMHRLHLLGRMGHPKDIAQITYDLAQADWMTGSIVTVDGGLNLG